MKILRAIGGFFAKIGRWIANTAWVQPLLIVGGIFAIIFSIPYIKKGFEGLFASGSVDEEYEWYKGHRGYNVQALSLEEGGQADRLLGYLEFYDRDADKIKSEFSTKFFLAFVQEGCSNCKDAVEGYKYAVDSGYVPGFQMFTILVDQMDSAGKKYLAKDIYKKHTGLFESLVGTYGETGEEDYPLYRNLIATDKADTVVGEGGLKAKSSKLDYASTYGDLETPLVMLVDMEKFDIGYYGVNGITQLFYNYIEFDTSSTVGNASKGMIVRDIWNYQNLFDPEFKA